MSLRRGWCELFNVDIISTDYSLIYLLVQQQKCIKARRKYASRETYRKTLKSNNNILNTLIDNSSKDTRDKVTDKNVDDSK